MRPIKTTLVLNTALGLPPDLPFKASSTLQTELPSGRLHAASPFTKKMFYDKALKGLTRLSFSLRPYEALVALLRPRDSF